MKTILYAVLLILLAQNTLSMEITLNIEEDINITEEANETSETYLSTNQKLKNATSWLILSATAILCTLLILKR